MWGRDFPVRYLLVREDIGAVDEGALRGRCAQVEGLFVDPPALPREVLTLRGCPRESLLGRAVAGTADPVRRLGEGEVWIEPADPPDDGPYQAWDLEDVAVLAHRPTTGDPGCVDVVIGAGVRKDDLWGTRGLPAKPRFDLWFPSLGEDAPSGSCHVIDGLFAPRPRRPSPPLHLIGCEPADPLLALLGRPHTQPGDSIALWCLDRHGRTMTRYHLDLHIVEARPSVLGAALVDITVTDPGDDRPASAARPVWEAWSDGVPTLPGQWAQFDAAGRAEWLDLTSVGPYGVDGRSGGVHHLDGRRVTDRTSLFLALGEALLGPGANYGTSLDALKDYLSGGPAVRPPFTLIWHHATTARTAFAGPASYFDQTVALLREFGVTVVHE